jgi:hypothetical protein
MHKIPYDGDFLRMISAANRTEGVYAMSRARLVLSLLLLVFSAGLAKADGLLCQLPKDGTWATYDLNMAMTMPGGESAAAKGVIRIASVGQATTDDNLPCRWIEVECKMAIAMDEHKTEKTQTWKMLIPEKYLAQGETPLDHVLKGWTWQDQGQPQKLDNPNDIDTGPLPLILSAPWKELKRLDKVAVDCKLGKVACDGVQGSLEFKTKDGQAMKCKLEARLHPDSPFGTATNRWTIFVPMMGESGMEWTLKLADFGENAQSKMPDAK